MDIKTKRILTRAFVNLFKLTSFALTVFVYAVLCIVASIKLTDNPILGLIGLFFPLVWYAVWDISKAQIETELNKEEQLIETIERGY